MISGIKSVKEAGGLEGKKVVLRLDLNVPIENGKILDDFRIQKALPVLEYLRDKGAVILAVSHLDAKGESLEAVGEYLDRKFPTIFIKDLFSDETRRKIDSLKAGSVILFENIRQYPEEKKNDEEFSKKIASLGDLYVNDAFPASHREHASIVGVPKFLPHYAGLQLEKEILNLRFDDNIHRPFLFILGGAKFDTKLQLIEKFLDKADSVFIGGALANDLLKAKGFEIGVSVISGIDFDQKILKDPQLVLPTDVVVKKGEEISVKDPQEVTKEDKIVDAGPKALKELSELISKAKLILWNGPLGFYEGGFDQPTKDLAKMIAESAAASIIGGGDTIAAIETLGIQDKFTFVSTGGGAMLEFLLNDTLPGIEALK